MKELYQSLPLRGTEQPLIMISTLRGWKLLDNLGIQLIFKNFEKTSLLRELKLPAWDIAVMIQSLTHHPYEPKKILSDS